MKEAPGDNGIYPPAGIPHEMGKKCYTRDIIKKEEFEQLKANPNSGIWRQAENETVLAWTIRELRLSG